MLKKIFALFASLTLLTLTTSPVFADSPVSSRPMVKLKDGSSTNWSGYAALTSLTNPQIGSVSDVKGSWVVPTMNCSGTTGHTYSSTWVGIDGYSDNTVEQTGTEDDCVNGAPQHYAWFEMYPKFPVNLSLSINAGDTITAEVRYVGKNSFSLTLTDNIRGWKLP